VVLPNQPVTWNADVTTFNAGNVSGGSLMLGPAERADVIVDFSAYAGKTLILYNDAPAPWPALDPHYDYYTDAPDNRDMGGSDTTAVGFGPNTRTIMQIKVAAGAGTAFDMAPLTEAFNPADGVSPGVFRDSQDPIIVGQGNLNPTADPALYEAFVFDGTDFSAYNSNYNTTFPATYPNWGISRINDAAVSFYNPTAAAIQTITMQKKAIQDEQGETFDEFGRMRAGLGLTLQTPAAGRVNFILQSYSDPPSEILAEDGIQVWKITHNGVDTHPVHFHLFDVQVLNRVGWDGFMRLPDPTELGWKDTVRISPLEDTIVALKPVTPQMPFGVPESIRPLNPATPMGDATALSLIDPVTGQAWATPNLNRMFNLDWEYVWHCHILSHEENDMMRNISFEFVETLPGTVTDVVATPNGPNQIDLTWTDPTPVADPATLGNHANEIKFRIERSTNSGAYTFLADALANATTYSDATALAGSTYQYRVFAVNAAGDSPLLTDLVGIYRNNRWFLDSNANNIWDGPTVDTRFIFGLQTDKSVFGDWNGDGNTEIGTYRNGQWYLDLNGNGVWDGEATDILCSLGGTADSIPVTGDWNGDGITDIGVFKSNTNTWFLDTNGNRQWDKATDLTTIYGITGDVPVVGNWTGVGADKIGVYRAGIWLLDTNGNGIWNGQTVDTRLDNFTKKPGDIPVVGDWNGSGIDKVGVYRAGVWLLDKNGNGVYNSQIVDTRIDNFVNPVAGDVPIVGKWRP
jgi:FtsP/CotA-like multicopper oxidase with cupredoxin domain